MKAQLKSNPLKPDRRPREDKPGESSKPARGRFKSKRIYWLVGLLLALVLVGWLGGGVTRVCNTFARRSLQHLDSSGARWWLGLADTIAFSDADSLLIKARLARQAGRYDEMTELLRRCESIDGDAERIHVEHLLARAQVGDLEEIESELNDRLGTAGQDHAELTDCYTNGLAALGRIDDLPPLLDAWEKDFPSDPRPNYRRGMMLEFRQNLDEAGKQYALATAKNPNHFPSWYSLGRTQQQRRQVETALSSYDQCKRMPNPLAAEVAIASCLRELGEIDQARAILQRVIQSDKQKVQESFQQVEAPLEGDPVARELGTLEADAGDYQRACEVLQRALEAEPNDLIARYALAIAQRGLGQKAESAKNFEHVQSARQALAVAPPLIDRVAKNPFDTESRLQLGDIHLKWESARKGIYWLQSILAYDPENERAHRMLADYYQRQVSLKPELASLALKHAQAANKARQP